MPQGNSSITSSNTDREITRRNLARDPNTPASETRSNITATGTGSNIEETRNATRHNDYVTGSNNKPPIEGPTNDAKEESTNIDAAIVTNPFQGNEDEDDGETLDDLGPELAKMGRILAREITKSLSKALVPLQNEINDLKTTSNCTENSEIWQSLKEENQKLQTKVHQLEINNTKLKMKLS